MPVKLAAGAVVAGVALLLARRGRKKVEPALHEPLSAHLAGAARPAPAAAAVPVSNPPAKGKRQYAALFFSLLATLLVSTAAAVCLMRESWDVAAAITVGWSLLLLQQAIQVNGGESEQVSAAAIAAADTTIQEEPLALPDISGTWIKDHQLSDPMEGACSLMRLNGLMRTAIKLVKGVKLTLNAEEFDVAVFSVISWFKIIERYHLSGTVSTLRRRDMRRGNSRGVVRPTPHGTILLSYEWGEPVAGNGTDEFELCDDGLLRVHTHLIVGDDHCKYTQVYRRK